MERSTPPAPTNFNATDMNGTEGISFHEEASSVRILKFLGSLVIALLSVVGNTLVIYVVRRMPQMRTNTYNLILNLSLADLLFTIIAMPPFISAIFGHSLLVEGYAGTFLCKFLNLAVFGLIASSVLTMTVIAWDRFFAIVIPFKRFISATVFRCLLAAIWLSSFLAAAPLLFTVRLGKTDNTLYCEEDWSTFSDNDSGPKLYAIALFILIFLIPLTTMTVLYSYICHYLWFRKVPGNSTHGNRKRATVSSQKVIRMLITLLVVFILCWLPLQVATLLMYFQEVILSNNFYFICDFLIRANGAINPILYVVFNERFRIGFKIALGSLCVWRNKDLSFKRQLYMLSIASHPGNTSHPRNTSNTGNTSSLRRGQRKETQV